MICATALFLMAVLAGAALRAAHDRGKDCLVLQDDVSRALADSNRFRTRMLEERDKAESWRSIAADEAKRADELAERLAALTPLRGADGKFARKAA